MRLEEEKEEENEITRQESSSSSSSSSEDDEGNANVAFIHGNRDFLSNWKKFSRECLQKDLKNANSLALTEKLLSKNPAEYTVWWFRLRCVKWMFDTFDSMERTAGEMRSVERRNSESAENQRFDATKEKLWRTDGERKERIEHLVANEKEIQRFREELIELGVEEVRLEEARAHFRSVDSPLIWYSAETLAKFRSGALTRRMLERGAEECESSDEDGDEEASTTSMARLFWQHSTYEDGLKALTDGGCRRDYIERLRACCEKMREIFPRTKYDILDEEYAFAEAMASKNPKNYQVWNHLRQIASIDDREFCMETSLLDQHSYRRRAFFFQSNVRCDGPFVHHFNDQMRSGAAIRSKYFVENIILFGDDGKKNIHAWTHYVWIAKHIDRNAWLDVFYASEMCVMKDPRNNSAWTARMNYAEFMMMDERENASNIINGWNNSEHLKWFDEDETVAKSIFDDGSSIEEKGFEIIQRETNKNHAMNDSRERSLNGKDFKNICTCAGADYSVWCTPGPRLTPEQFLAFDAVRVMENVLGFDVSLESYANPSFSNFSGKESYAPDSEAAVNYVLGLFALMKKMSGPTLPTFEREMRAAFLKQSEKKINQMNALTKRDYEAKIALGESQKDFPNIRIESEAQFERELNAFRRLKVCANLSAAQVKAFRERLEGKDEEELRTLSSNPSSARDSVEDGLSANAQKSLKRCLVADPVRSNFYKNQFWALKERERSSR